MLEWPVIFLSNHFADFKIFKKSSSILAPEASGTYPIINIQLFFVEYSIGYAIGKGEVITRSNNCCTDLAYIHFF